MIATNRADREKKAFWGTDAWFPKKASAWVGKLDGGKHTRSHGRLLSSQL